MKHKSIQSVLLFLFAWLLAMPGTRVLSTDCLGGKLPTAEKSETHETNECESESSLTASARRARGSSQALRVVYLSPLIRFDTRPTAFFPPVSRQASLAIVPGNLPLRV
ncbi:hypothetical protein K2X33_01765 [bacterium]|nr:hypothetical protein [bacterium]